MTTVLLILQFVLAGIITVLVLLQKSSSIGLGAYSGSNESLFGAKGASGFLAKATAVMGFVFIVNCLALGYFYQKESSKSILDSVSPKTIQIPQGQAPTAPAAPTAPTTK